MVEIISHLIDALNKITPLGLSAGLAYIVYSIAAKKGRVRLISDNHLSGLPSLEANILALVESSRRQETSLTAIASDLSYLKGTINARQ
jgi:hypothetical protein